MVEDPARAAKVELVDVKQGKAGYNDYKEENEGDNESTDEDSVLLPADVRQKWKEKKTEADLIIATLNLLNIVSQETNMAQSNQKEEPRYLIRHSDSLPNLEELSLTLIGQSQNTSFLHKAMKNAISLNATSPSARFCSMLSRVDCVPEYPEYCIDFREVEHFFHIPSLRKLFVYELAIYELLWAPSHSLSNLEVLELQSSGIDNTVWDLLLRLLNNLKRLIFLQGNPKHIGFMGMDLSSIGQSLHLVKEILESLELKDFYVEGEGEEDFLGDLTGFPKLKNIEVQVAMLISTEKLKARKILWDILPRSIERLSLWRVDTGYGSIQDREDAIDHLVGFVLKKQSRLPHLKELD